jgi:hypothetical protein
LEIFDTADEIWDAVRAEIDGGRPVIFSSRAHARVITGYDTGTGDRRLILNNPARPGRWDLYVDDPGLRPRSVVFYFLPPVPTGRRQEASVTIDTDGDEVRDFDEIERFFTDPRKLDSDDDGVNDKQDIAAGVFDPFYGYAMHTSSTRGRDFDGDGTPTELDRDSDDGGCRDGIEDQDGDGHRIQRETWNFNEVDDLCRDVQGRIVYSSIARGKGPIATYRSESLIVNVRLKPERPGEMGILVDDGSKYRAHSVSVVELPGVKVNGCHPIGRQSLSQTGRFGAPGTDIGGGQDPDELVVGASIDGRGRASADWCLWVGAGPIEDTVSLPDCPGKREVTVGSEVAYIFACTTPPDLPAGYVWLEWHVTGRVRLSPPSPASLSIPVPLRPLRLGYRETDEAGPHARRLR